MTATSLLLVILFAQEAVACSFGERSPVPISAGPVGTDARFPVLSGEALFYDLENAPARIELTGSQGTEIPFDTQVEQVAAGWSLTWAIPRAPLPPGSAVSVHLAHGSDATDEDLREVGVYEVGEEPRESPGPLSDLDVRWWRPQRVHFSECPGEGHYSVDAGEEPQATGFLEVEASLSGAFSDAVRLVWLEAWECLGDTYGCDDLPPSLERAAPYSWRARWVDLSGNAGPWTEVDPMKGCACDATPRGVPWSLAAVALVLRRRRRFAPHDATRLPLPDQKARCRGSMPRASTRTA